MKKPSHIIAAISFVAFTLFMAVSVIYFFYRVAKSVIENIDWLAEAGLIVFLFLSFSFTVAGFFAFIKYLVGK